LKISNHTTAELRDSLHKMSNYPYYNGKATTYVFNVISIFRFFQKTLRLHSLQASGFRLSGRTTMKP